MMKISKNIIISVSAAVLIGIIVLLYFVFGNNPPAHLTSVEVKSSDIAETVNLNGQVKASQGVDLAFVTSGKIVADYVKVGDKIYAGQTLAVLNQGSARATLTSAQGSLAQAKANYAKLLAGTTQQNIQIVNDSINLSKQDLTNAYNGAINTLNTGYTTIYNADFVVKSVQDAYFPYSDTVGLEARNAKMDLDNILQNLKIVVDKVKVSGSTQDIDLAVPQEIIALNNVYNDINIIRVQTDQDTYKNRIPDAQRASLDGQKTAISTTLTAVTALQQNIASLKLVLQREEDKLNVTTAPPTQAEIDLANAQVLSAQGQVDSAEASLNNTVLTALFSGQVDKDNIVAGQIALPNTPVITISNDNLEIDTNISEVDLASAKIGGKANITLDSFGNSVIFPATIFSIDLSPTIVDGVSAYGARLKFDSYDTRIKPGMTANIMMISDTHKNVLVVPKSAVIQNNGKYFVLVDSGTPNKETRQVTIGFHDNQNIEITSGLKLGEKVFTY